MKDESQFGSRALITVKNDRCSQVKKWMFFHFSFLEYHPVTKTYFSFIKIIIQVQYKLALLTVVTTSIQYNSSVKQTKDEFQSRKTKVNKWKM